MKVLAEFVKQGYAGSLDEYKYTFDYDDHTERAVFAQRCSDMLAEGWEVTTSNRAYYRPLWVTAPGLPGPGKTAVDANDKAADFGLGPMLAGARRMGHLL